MKFNPFGSFMITDVYEMFAHDARGNKFSFKKTLEMCFCLLGRFCSFCCSMFAFDIL